MSAAHVTTEAKRRFVVA